MVESLAAFPFWVLGASLLYAVFSTFRFSVALGMLERPLVVAFVFGLIGADWTTCLGVGIFFEIIWLDLFPAGTYIPPHGTAAAMGALSLIQFFGLNSPSELPLPLACGVIFGLAGKRLDVMLRKRENATHNSLLLWGKHAQPAGNVPPLPEWFVMRSWLSAAAVNLFFFLVFFLVFSGILSLAVQKGLVFVSPELRWFHLWLFAAVGGLLSLRQRKAYILLTGIVLLGAVYRFLF